MPAWIYFGNGWQEKHIAAGGDQQLHILFDRDRVVLEILRIVELRGVDEDAAHNQTIRFAGSPYQ